MRSCLRLAWNLRTGILADSIWVTYIRITQGNPMQKMIPRTSKTITYPSAHTYLANIWECPLGRAL